MVSIPTRRDAFQLQPTRLSTDSAPTSPYSGFCGETEDEHADTVSLMNLMRYEQAFMFAYSMREKTAASRHLVDDVPEETKKRRLAEVIAAQRRGCVLSHIGPHTTAWAVNADP